MTTATPDEFADYLVNEYWTQKDAKPRNWIEDNIGVHISEDWSASEKASAESAIQQWDDVLDLSFSESTEASDIDIILGSDRSAWSQTWVNGAGGISRSIVSLDPTVYGSPEEPGGYGLTTLIHEVGHSLGLGHPGPYDGWARFASDALWLNDTRQYSVMSYFNAHHSGAEHRDAYAVTPLLYDIYAAQKIYGPDMSTRSGDTVYGFNADAARLAFDFSANDKPVLAIWDAGGTDTLDLSGYQMDQRVTLTAGEFSDIGGLTANIAICYGVTIENLVAGTGDDVIIGNEADNRLEGLAGDDTFEGGGGNDTLIGGPGSDFAVFGSKPEDFKISISDTTSITLEWMGGPGRNEGHDWAEGIEYFDFSGEVLSFAELHSLASAPHSDPGFDQGPPPDQPYQPGLLRLDGDGIMPYSFGQDKQGSAQVSADGTMVEFSGNLWKRLAIDSVITEDTILTFDFYSAVQGEIHAIGIDNDNYWNNSSKPYQLFGSQNWLCNTDCNTYQDGDGWQSFSIPVGEAFRGQANYLTFINDHDVPTPTAHSMYRNIRLYEPDAEPDEVGGFGISAQADTGLASASETLESSGQILHASWPTDLSTPDMLWG